jgi:hypothetical protein
MKMVTPSQEMSGQPTLSFAPAMFLPSHTEFFNILKQNGE